MATPEYTVHLPRLSLNAFSKSAQSTSHSSTAFGQPFTTAPAAIGQFVTADEGCKDTRHVDLGSLDLSMGSTTAIFRRLRLGHSQRSATIGSIERALRAGTMQASAATRMSSPDAARTMIGSCVPLSIQRAMRRFRLKLSARPATVPKPTLAPAESATMHQTRKFSVALSTGGGSPGCCPLGPRLATSLRSSGHASRPPHR